MFYISNGFCFHNVCQNKSCWEIIEICIVIVSRNRSSVVGKTRYGTQRYWNSPRINRVLCFYEPATRNVIFAHGLFDFRFLFPDRSKSPRSRKSASDLCRGYKRLNDGPLSIFMTPIIQFRFPFPIAPHIRVSFSYLYLFFSLFSSLRSSFVCATTSTREHVYTLHQYPLFINLYPHPL